MAEPGLAQRKPPQRSIAGPDLAQRRRPWRSLPLAGAPALLCRTAKAQQAGKAVLWQAPRVLEARQAAAAVEQVQ